MNDDAFRLVRRDHNPDKHDPKILRQRLQDRKLPETLHDFLASAKHFQLDSHLETAINMALAVGAPLLLTGEPGTGKTQVAWYLGWYFGIDVFHYQVRSTSTAEDMKYDFDAVAYLRTARAGSGVEDAADRETFLTKKALWLAYESVNDAVLLIDEIDKAPRDFPNDLLQELDKHQFKHPFREEMIRPRNGRPPIVVVTSNAERRLPDAFLRRCIFHHIEVEDWLVEAAVGSHFPRLDAALKNEALARFWELRENEQVQKKPSTAEVLVWLAILSARGARPEELKVDNPKDLPGIKALIKDKADWDRL